MAYWGKVEGILNVEKCEEEGDYNGMSKGGALPWLIP